MAELFRFYNFNKCAFFCLLFMDLFKKKKEKSAVLDFCTFIMYVFSLLGGIRWTGNLHDRTSFPVSKQSNVCACVRVCSSALHLAFMSVQSKCVSSLS